MDTTQATKKSIDNCRCFDVLKNATSRAVKSMLRDGWFVPPDGSEKDRPVSHYAGAVIASLLVSCEGSPKMSPIGALYSPILPLWPMIFLITNTPANRIHNDILHAARLPHPALLISWRRWRDVYEPMSMLCDAIPPGIQSANQNNRCLEQRRNSRPAFLGEFTASSVAAAHKLREQEQQQNLRP